MDPYTNTEIAKDYLSVILQETLNSALHKGQQQCIETCPIPIADFHHKHGSVEALSVPHMTKKTKYILDLLINDGLKGARDRFYEELNLRRGARRWSAPEKEDDMLA